jgi:hypothetical protein
MTDRPEALPLWGWYVSRWDVAKRVRAMHMDRDFNYESIMGGKRAPAGWWLVTEPDGKNEQGLSDEYFRSTFDPLDPARPESGQPPEPAPPFEEKPLEPDTEALQ